MVRIKKLALAALVAFALAAGGLATGAEAAQPASSPGCNPPLPSKACHESASLPPTPDELQIASSAGTRAKIGRESS